MTAGPATRLLNAFCLLAADWFGDETIDCAVHDGRFEAAELERFGARPPAARVASLGVASASSDGDGAARIDFRIAAVAIGWDAGGESRGEMARRIADRLAFELARPQQWARAVFNPDGLDRTDPNNPLSRDWPGGSRGPDLSCPREIRAANFYTSDSDKDGFGIWAVTWLQQFRVRLEDFTFEAPEVPALPDTVLAGTEPNVGTGHEGDYETVVPAPGGSI